MLLIVMVLAAELHGFVSNLIDRRRPTVRLRRQTGDWLTDPSVLAMTYIIIILKLLFQLDDVTEK